MHRALMSHAHFEPQTAQQTRQSGCMCACMFVRRCASLLFLMYACVHISIHACMHVSQCMRTCRACMHHVDACMHCVSPHFIALCQYTVCLQMFVLLMLRCCCVFLPCFHPCMYVVFVDVWRCVCPACDAPRRSSDSFWCAMCPLSDVHACCVFGVPTLFFL